MTDRSILATSGRLQRQFLGERYWERMFLVVSLPIWKWRYGKCEDRAGFIRRAHSFDKDSRCVFCDWLKPDKESRKW